MTIKALLMDFDGTLVTRSMLDYLINRHGKDPENRAIKRSFHTGEKEAIVTLQERVSLLSGLSLTRLQEILNEELFLRTGARELIQYAKENDMKVILHSGNIVPVLNYYKELLGIDAVVGVPVTIENSQIGHIENPEKIIPSFKVDLLKALLPTLNLVPEECVAFGDSPSDKDVFSFAGKSIAVAPKGGVEQFADYTVERDLTEAIEILKSL